MIAPVCVADRDIEFDSFVVAADVAADAADAADIAADVAADVAAVVAIVVGVDVVDAVAGTVVAIAVTAVAAVAAAVAAGPVVFVAPNQPPRKKIRRGQRSRYQTPFVTYIYVELLV